MWGFATVETLDQQGDIVSYEASLKAFDEWSNLIQKASGGKSKGNVREMHGNKVVGGLIHWEGDDKAKGVYVGARISKSADGDNAWTKVIEGNLNGFSIGAPTAERRMELDPKTNQMVNKVTAYKMAELSLVDNMSCPNTQFQVVKMADGQVQSSDAFEPMSPDASPHVIPNHAAPSKVSMAVEIDGQLYKFTRTPVETKETGIMDAPLIKAGKKIGPSPKSTQVHAAPGEQKPKKPATGADPMGQPKPAKSAGEVNTGEAGGPHEISSDEITEPKGQGKAADAAADAPAEEKPEEKPDMNKAEPEAAPATEEPTDEAIKMECDPCGAQMKQAVNYCPNCGNKMAMQGDEAEGHPAPASREQTSTGEMGPAGKAAAAGLGQGLQKFVEAQFSGMKKEIVGYVSKLEKRLNTLENQPAPGGPARAELPDGVVALNKAAGTKISPRLAREDVLKGAMELVEDPYLKDKLGQELAKSAIFSAHEARDAGRKVM